MSFQVVAQVSWMNNSIQKINLVGMSEIFGNYPLISSKFFDDLVLNMKNQTHYWAESGFQSLVMSNTGYEPKEYEPHEWIFLAATDFQNRAFHILFSRSIEMKGKGAIAAIGPNEFAGFMKGTGKDAIVATLSLINDPTKMKSVAIVVSRPKDAKDKMVEARDKQDMARFQQWIGKLNSDPNLDGQWFPTNDPICPNCNARMLGFADIRVGFVKMICPRCGKEMNKKYK